MSPYRPEGWSVRRLKNFVNWREALWQRSQQVKIF